MSGLAGLDIDAITKRGSIREADVAGLARRHDAGTALTAAEADALLRLHTACPVQDAAWPARLVDVLTDHVVHQAKPEGYLTVENADWLLARIVRHGRIATLAEFELLVRALEASRWSPERMLLAALGAVRDAIVSGTGPLRSGAAAEPRHVTAADTAWLARILVAFGGNARLAPTQGAAEVLFAIDSATADGDNAAEWHDLYAKAIGLSLMAASHYAVPEPAVAFNALGASASDGRPASPALEALVKPALVLSYCHLQTAEQRAIERLERQRIAIITGEEPARASPQWLLAHFGDAGRRATRNELATLRCLADADIRLDPPLADLIVRLGCAA